MSRPEIPGYYFDEAKRRYFKIEKAQTASTNNPYTTTTTTAILKATASAHHAAQTRHAALVHHLVRSPLMTPTTLPFTARLARECGPDLGMTDGTAYGRWKMQQAVRDVGVQEWVAGLRVMGRAPLRMTLNASYDPERISAGYGIRRETNVANLWVEDAGGRGTAMALSSQRNFLTLTYMPHRRGRLVPTWKQEDSPHISGIPLVQELSFFDQVSAITVDHTRTRMFMTSSMPSEYPKIAIGELSINEIQTVPYEPRLTVPAMDNFTMLEAFSSINPSTPHNDLWSTYSLRLAPANSDMIVSIGGTRGLVQLRACGTVVTYASPRPSRFRKSSEPQEPRDIFAHDFLAESSSVTIAGGGGVVGGVWIIDARVQDTVTMFKHGSGVVNLKVLDQNKIVISGLKDRMCIYDLRNTRERPQEFWLPPGPDALTSGAKRIQVASATPVFEFPGYQNKARYGLGFAVSTELGLVCTANDRGGTALHSLKTGRRIASPSIDHVDGGEAPILCMQFADVGDGSRMPSLFMGVGSSVYKFSRIDQEEEAWLERGDKAYEEAWYRQRSGGIPIS